MGLSQGVDAGCMVEHKGEGSDTWKMGTVDGQQPWGDVAAGVGSARMAST